jgi:putative DNA primase/helicase
MWTEKGRRQLLSWGLSTETAQSAGMFETHDVKSVYSEMKSGPGIVIPYWSPAGGLLTYQTNGHPHPFARVRRLDADAGTGFIQRKPARYLQPAHTGPQVYLPPFVPWTEIMDDVAHPIIITEGEAKALCACAEGFTVMALGGVYSFASANGDLLPALAQFTWENRHVYIAFDSDAATNPKVLAAEARLVAELQGRANARCHIVRLPSDGPKVGLDDYLVQHGAAELDRLLASAPALSSTEARVIAMNKRYAWIDREGQVWDADIKQFVRKDSFQLGHEASAEQVIVAGQRGVPKKLALATLWLKHPHARRFSEALFRPGLGLALDGEHGRAINMWTGWESEPGDVAPWLRLTDYVLQRLPKEHRALPVQLMAYKAQNPREKIPLGLILVGTEGSGKTLWAECLREAFAPYSATINPASLSSDFQGWLEKSVCTTIHEMTTRQMDFCRETLKSLVSDARRSMNEKFRPVREIESYAQYIITTNHRGVAGGSADDRRWVVVDCPPHGPDELYDTAWAWRLGGGPRALMHWLLNYDLKGWRPPQKAPMTAEKAMAHQESLSPVEALAELMQGANDHVVVEWLDGALAWAGAMEISGVPAVAQQARAVASSVKLYQIRPWYTPEELSMMFPALVETLVGTKFQTGTPSGMLSRILREAGVPYLVNTDNPRGFMHRGMLRQYLVVYDPDEWARPLGQADFDRAMKRWPTYSEWKAQRRG